MLRKLQTDFAAAVFDNETAALEKEIKQTGISSVQLIDVYRNNTFSVQATALRLTYTAVERIIGEKDFTKLAHEFLKKYRSHSGNLDDFGKEFPEFLKGKTDKEYLYPLAKFELLYQESLLADKAENFDASQLTGMAQEKFFDLRFKFAPPVRLMESQFALTELWTESDPAKININKNENILITKPELKPDVFLVSAAEFAALVTLQQGGTFYEAFDTATSIEDDFRIEYFLKENIIRGVFTGLIIK